MRGSIFIRAIDGNTIESLPTELRDSMVDVHVRLNGIDVPERNEPRWQCCRDILETLCRADSNLLWIAWERVAPIRNMQLLRSSHERVIGLDPRPSALDHRCPDCARGNVYTQKEPKALVRIVGQAPLAATVYELERLRCNACGQLFTAEEPEGAGPDKYDETASAMIVQLKYGSGIPFLSFGEWKTSVAGFAGGRLLLSCRCRRLAAAELGLRRLPGRNRLGFGQCAPDPAHRRR